MAASISNNAYVKSPCYILHKSSCFLLAPRTVKMQGVWIYNPHLPPSRWRVTFSCCRFWMCHLASPENGVQISMLPPLYHYLLYISQTAPLGWNMQNNEGWHLWGLHCSLERMNQARNQHWYSLGMLYWLLGLYSTDDQWSIFLINHKNGDSFRSPSIFKWPCEEYI